MKTGLSKAHVILLAFIAGNLLLVLLFPPCDYLALAHRGLPTFDGFYFLLDLPANRRINDNVLVLEMVVILINGCLGYLLLEHIRAPEAHGRITRYLIGFLILNLSLAILFPPFSDYRMLSRNGLPSFEGFYFIFGDNSQRRLVDEILFLEIAMLLANAGLIWLIVRERELQERMLEQHLPVRLEAGKRPG